MIERLAHTVVARPYVFAFLACYLWIARRHLGALRAALYLVVAFVIAFAAEYSSTRNGFPFGHYTYIDVARDRELWISNVPFWDSLSFVFLSYFSWRVAGAVRSPTEAAKKLFEIPTFLLAGLFMMLLDVVIDPVALVGERWFLGKVYFYPDPGPYFGVTLANFAGWFAVGAVIPFVFGFFVGRKNPNRAASDSLACFGVYAGVFAFNIAVTAWIGYWSLFAASAAVALAVCVPCALRRRAA